MLWDPDTDVNALTRCNPKRLTGKNKRRHRLLLDEVLLKYPSEHSLAQVRKILFVYPYLEAEYGARLLAAERRLEEEDDARRKTRR